MIKESCFCGSMFETDEQMSHGAERLHRIFREKHMVCRRIELDKEMLLKHHNVLFNVNETLKSLRDIAKKKTNDGNIRPDFGNGLMAGYDSAMRIIKKEVKL